MSRTNKLFMAVARGKVSTEQATIKRYIGVAPVFITSINPTKEELSEIYNTTVENDPIYIGEAEVGPNKDKVEQIRIDFIVKTDGSKCIDNEGNPIEMITKVSFFIRNAPKMNRAGDKIQVLDKYGRTGWVTKEEFDAKKLPSYIDNPAKLDSNYRAAYWGEEELVKFIKAFLCIGNPEKWADKKIVGLIDKPEDCEIMFDTIPLWFKGDIKEIKDAVSCQPNNEVRVLFGIRTTDENKQYQSVFTQSFIPMNANKDKAYASLSKEVTERKNNGAYPSTEFEVCDLKEYKITPTVIDDGDMPEEIAGTSFNPWAK